MRLMQREANGQLRSCYHWPPSPHTATAPTLSLLGNATMETYERSNCVGGHRSAVFTQSDKDQISTDFMFWMTVDVPCGASGNNPSCQTPGQNTHPAAGR